jgi:hypothetical protein
MMMLYICVYRYIYINGNTYKIFSIINYIFFNKNITMSNMTYVRGFVEDFWGFVDLKLEDFLLLGIH